MTHCVQDILSGCGVEGTSKTPAGDHLFDVRDDATKATIEQSKWFHTHVAKMLYLSKRVKPECLTTVIFLAGRVDKCDEDDIKKLCRLLKYLRLTADRGIALEIGDEIKITVYIDAAYGVHMGSGRSQSGMAVMVGSGPVEVSCGKQHINTKSSTEAELVALSDYASYGIHLKNFLAAQGYDVNSCELRQDNMSTIALIKRGGPASAASKHISIRYFWIKDRVASGEVTVMHTPTEDMIANVLTKPVQGKQFELERQMLTNW
jgi:hypothetical protein